MKTVSHKALDRASTALIVAAVVCIAGLLIPRPIEPPDNPPPGSVTIVASPRDAGVYKQAAMSETSADDFLGTVGTPILLERLSRDGTDLPSELQLKIRREGFEEKALEFESELQVKAFLSKAVWPHSGVLRLEPESTSALVKVWLRERTLPVSGLLLVGILGAVLAQAKGKAARRADLLERCKSEAGKDPYIGTTLKEFLLLELLGRGNFGMVYRAIPESRAGDKDAAAHAVAIKISTNLDPKAIQRFYQELDVAKRAEHPNNVRIFDKGLTPDDSPFLVMELLKGTSMTDLITKTSPDEQGDPEYLAFSPEKVVEMIEPVVEGLQHAHDQGVVHRDLNPNNIMVLDTGGVKILDFGLSKILANRGLTMTQDAGAGTLCYIPHEQIVGFGKVDARADQFSLGCMMYHMLGGSHPFGDMPFEVLSKVSQKQKPRPLLQVAPNLREQTVAVVERMLEHDPEARYPTTREAFAAFKQSLR